MFGKHGQPSRCAGLLDEVILSFDVICLLRGQNDTDLRASFPHKRNKTTMTSFFFIGTTAILTTCKENNLLICWKERC